ncbi:glycerophosphodiester phosphodiesterase [Streptomyces sp. ODS28]|uniref:glycerophosphodiester phosphodiesterase n=1 Tax=Streptomyces sp. ODS28 TaxID=3136688 RepID=UPI0031E5D4E9
MHGRAQHPAVTAVAHRGAPYAARENTLTAFRAALAAGADAVELDVRLTRDGVPVVLHDRTLERLWGIERAVRSLTAKDLAERTAGQAGGVPTLEAALEVTAGARTLIDFPDPAAVPAALGVVRETGAGDRVYYCGGPAAMRAVRAADPAAELSLTWQRAAPVRDSLLEAVRPRWLNLPFGLLNRELTDRLHERGLLVSAWTADSRRTMRRLLALGADSVTTNRIGTLRALLDDGAGRRPAGR